MSGATLPPSPLALTRAPEIPHSHTDLTNMLQMGSAGLGQGEEGRVGFALLSPVQMLFHLLAPLHGSAEVRKEPKLF